MSEASWPSVRLGIIAAACIAKKIVKAALAHPTGVEFVAVGSRNLSKAEEFISENGLVGKAAAYGSYEEVLHDERVDAVYIPLPSALHLHWVRQAAAAGKHVLCEKPVSVELSECEAIVQVCKEAGVMFMDGTMWLHNPRVELMAKVLHEDKLLGPVAHIMCNFSFTLWDTENNIRMKKDMDGLGVLGDIGWYCTAMALWVKQYKAPATAAAHPGATFTADGVPTSIGATLIWADGTTATFFTSFKSCFSQDTKILGPVGTLSLTDSFLPEDEQCCSFFLKEKPKDTTIFKYGCNSEVKVHPEMPQEAFMMRTFARCVAEVKAGGKPDWSWVHRSQLTQRVLCAVMASAQDGCKAVPVQALEVAS